MPEQKTERPPSHDIRIVLAVVLACSGLFGVWKWSRQPSIAATAIPAGSASATSFPRLAGLDYQPRKPIDTSGFGELQTLLEPWPRDASLARIATAFERAGRRAIDRLDREILQAQGLKQPPVPLLISRSLLFSFEGDTDAAYAALAQARAQAALDPVAAREWLSMVVYMQGVVALRRGENDNCILCRGDSSCILPIVPAAVHTNPLGSRRAIEHFGEYLEIFPDDVGARWLLNLAHMTLGEHPDQVDPRYVMSLDHFRSSESSIGKFRDVGALVGVNRLNQAGGAIMDDFDGDGLLDIVVTSMDPTQPMALYRNRGDGRFEDATDSAGLSDQLGGLYCVQTDYNNDGRLDIFIPRGAWLPWPMRPSLLRNDGDCRFTDVTREAGLLEPVNSISASWTDYDNDGWLDLFVCCEQQANRLYHSRRDGTFEEVASGAGVAGDAGWCCKGSAWFDYDNDGFPDLFLNNLTDTGHLYHNERDGTFAEVTDAMHINGPQQGFSCWAFDYDNDGWLDLFATCFERNRVDLVVDGFVQHSQHVDSNRLYRNREGRGFEDVTQAAGLDRLFLAMGSSFSDFDNDGFLDMYLGTGSPSLDHLVPNRMFKNVAGRCFADVTGSSGTGHLQKGHGVACGDWDRDGDVDIFIEMGGATNGDKFHNLLFENPGTDHHWTSIKLVGVKTNRAALGARIKIVTAADPPLTIHRHVSTGSSFGANPLEQTIGLGRTDRISLLEINWPASGSTQVFRDLPVDQAIEVTEFAEQYRALDRKPIPLPR